ncbi:hypothetical protein [Paenibacillus koleovorans]|uniref:hypothetical protein n=1 Tax=Paenibacillus koleovorans TaxID=121608 RepID=UPI001C3FA9F3|nr:hypothetical protein [Paenibacillus koleovorans]
MRVRSTRFASLTLVLAVAAVLASGCAQPASSTTGGPVGASYVLPERPSETANPQQGATSPGSSASPIPGGVAVTSSPSSPAVTPTPSGTIGPEKDPVAASGVVGSLATPTSSAAPTPTPAQTPTPTPESTAAPTPTLVQTSTPTPTPLPQTNTNSSTNSNKPVVLTFKDLYSAMTVRGVSISDQVKQLAGKKVEMTGYMAPPLTAKVNFFVLTKVAMSLCPFCSSDADWPTDIVVVYMPKGKNITPTEHQVKVTGTLSVGSKTDEETGFVSLIRLESDKVEVLN